VWESLQNFVLLLPRLFQGLVTKDFERCGKLLVSWSPSINSVNDHTGFYLQRRFFDLYGFWGHCFQIQGGANCGAQYAFLPLVVLWKLGVCGFLLVSISAYAGLFLVLYKVGTLSVSPLTWMLVGISALCSPYFKNATFAAGRYDILGWPLLIIGLVLLLEYHLSWAFLVLTFAFMSHPSVTLVGAAFMAVFIVIGRVDGEGILCFVCAQGLNLFWTIPFLRVKKLKNLTAHSWAVPLMDRTRTRSVYIPKLLGMLFFVLSYISLSTAPLGLAFCLVPFAVFIFNWWKDKFINRFSVELLWLSSGAAALAYAPEPFLCVPYLVSLFVYASPSPRFAFPFRPYLVRKQEILTRLKSVYNSMGYNIRMGFVTCPRDADQWRLDAKYKFIFNLGLFGDRQWVELFDIGLKGRNQRVGRDSHEKEQWEQHLKNWASRYGLDYVVSVADYKSRLDGIKWLSKIAECEIGRLGSVPSGSYLLYKVTCPVARASSGCRVMPLPTGELKITHPGGRVGVKYNALPGLRVVQDHDELAIYADENGEIVLHCPNTRPVKILRAPIRLWLPKGKIRQERQSAVLYGMKTGQREMLGK